MKEKEELLSEREAEIVGYRERLSYLLENKGEIKELRTLLANLREEDDEEYEEEKEEGKECDEKEEKGDDETKEDYDNHVEDEKKEDTQNEKESKSSAVPSYSMNSTETEKTRAASMSLQLPEREMDVGVSVGTNTSLTGSTDMSGVEGAMESSSGSALQGLSPMIISALLTPPRTKVPVPMDSRVMSAQERENRTRGGGEGRGGGQGGGGGSDGTLYTQGVQVNSRPSSKETAVTGWHTRELL